MGVITLVREFYRKIKKLPKESAIWFVLGCLSGYWTSFYFEQKAAKEQRQEIIWNAIYEVNMNLSPQLYPMYFDSLSCDSVSWPYPELRRNALDFIILNYHSFRNCWSDSTAYSSFLKDVINTGTKLSDFNQRIQLRNASIVSGLFNTSHNGKAYHHFQIYILPNLLTWKNTLIDALNQQ